jgi:hypothetical protein
MQGVLVETFCGRANLSRYPYKTEHHQVRKSWQQHPSHYFRSRWYPARVGSLSGSSRHGRPPPIAWPSVGRCERGSPEVASRNTSLP